MIKLIDDFLNNITMYRLVLYFLIILVAIAAIFCFVGILPYNGLGFLFSVTFLLAIGYVTNKVFAQAFNSPTNFESVYISSLILALIVAPPKSFHDLPFLFWAVVWTMAGKFIFAYRHKHLFNPVALGIFLPALFFGDSATWWIGNSAMFLPILIGGLLIARKIQRLEMTLTFIVVNILTILVISFNSSTALLDLLSKVFFHTPILFFAFIMFTEPLTAPPTRNLRFVYAIITGILFAPRIAAPENALLVGNLFAYLVSSKEKLLLTLVEKIQLTPDTYDFVFKADRGFNFQPGQYLEWTLVHSGQDSRGHRRYLTISSSPTEGNLRIGVKFPPEKLSSFKNSLLSLNSGDTITAGSLAGDFTLPKNPSQKLAFIAGGIGITPFRSIIKYLTDTNQKRDIVLLYMAKSADEFVYQDVFAATKTIYIVGHLEASDLISAVPDYRDRLFFLSGPHGMVTTYETVLKNLKVPASHLKIDYFPGY